jgi:hypothetical protein
MKVENKYIEPFQEVFILKYPDEPEHETEIPVGAILRITKIFISQTLYFDYTIQELSNSHIYVYIDGQRNFDLIGLAINPTGIGVCDLVIPVRKSYKFEFVPDENIGAYDFWFIVHIEGYIEAE